jgi:proline dehydrogenase
MQRGRRTVARLFKLVPKPLVWRFARVYIAGETIEDAVRAIRGLNREGCRATVDVLGEDVADEREVAAFVDAYRSLIEAIVREGLDSNISIKPTAMGLKIGPDLAYRSTVEVLRAAAKHNLFVRMDMEDSSTTTTTLELFERLRGEGFANVGVVLQSMLRRTLHDARRLAGLGASVRLVKGIYVEPREVAYQDYDTIRLAFINMMDVLMASPAAYSAIATHDEFLVEAARRMILKYDLPTSRYEYQMLLGVDPQLRRLLVAEGHPMRVYVPYGKGWHGYSIRRLVENPKMASHVARNVLGFGPGSEAAATPR